MYFGMSFPGIFKWITAVGNAVVWMSFGLVFMVLNYCAPSRSIGIPGTNVTKPETYCDSFARMKWSIGILAGAVLAASGCSSAFSEAEEKAALEKGASLADASFKALSAQLQHAMKEGGPAHAVDFCSLNALSIVDSLSAAHGAQIRRTSDRIRAPHDRPDAEETRYLQAMLEEWKAGATAADLSARAVVHGESVAYYQPIFINSPACLKCHGIPGENLDASALAVINERYPDDQATGYAMGDLRGMWSIRWAR